MAKPVRWIMIALAAAFAGLASLILGIASAQPVHRHWQNQSPPPENLLPFIAATGGALVLVLALVVGSLALMFALRRHRLRAGRSVVARWRVPPSDWSAFRAWERDREPLASLQNRISLADEAPKDGMEIIIGEKAIVVGDGCYGLGAGSIRMRSKWLADLRWVDPTAQAPGGLEFIEYTYGPSKAFVLFVSRLPVPALARGDAWRAFEYFQAIIVPEKRAAVRQIFAAELAAIGGDVEALPEVRARDRRNLIQQGYAALFGASIGFAYWLWAMTGPARDPGTIFIPLVFIPFALIGIILIVQGRRTSV